jgi:hypothetical protein
MMAKRPFMKYPPKEHTELANSTDPPFRNVHKEPCQVRTHFKRPPNCHTARKAIERQERWPFPDIHRIPLAETPTRNTTKRDRRKEAESIGARKARRTDQCTGNVYDDKTM